MPLVDIYTVYSISSPRLPQYWYWRRSTSRRRAVCELKSELGKDWRNQGMPSIFDECGGGQPDTADVEDAVFWFVVVEHLVV